MAKYWKVFRTHLKIRETFFSFYRGGNAGKCNTHHTSRFRPPLTFIYLAAPPPAVFVIHFPSNLRRTSVVAPLCVHTL